MNGEAGTEHEPDTPEREAARALLQAIEGGKAIMMRAEVERVARAVLAPFSSGRPGVSAPDAPIVALDTAFVWRCACGRSHFVTAHAVDADEGRALQARAVEAGQVPAGAEIQFATTPEVVACEPGCGAIYRTSE